MGRAVAPLRAGRGRWRSGGGGGGGHGRRAVPQRAVPLRAYAVPAGVAASLGAGLPPPPDPHPSGPGMGARASGWPRARAGLLLLLPLLLALLAPGAQGARGRGGAEKNSHRRTVHTFWQSVTSLLGEDNVRAAQKVGAGPVPAVTFPAARTWRLGRARPPGRGETGTGDGGARDGGA